MSLNSWNSQAHIANRLILELEVKNEAVWLEVEAEVKKHRRTVLTGGES